MITCGACGAESPDRFKFCPECAAPLQAVRPVAQERKVVTSLFCDLVGFTSMSEAADPEDVDAVLGRYFTVARAAIEAFGGVVEKFIGDAVVGVFGVPSAHEDDPERAVRAGLRIVEAVEGLIRPDGSLLQLRVGVNTGEALVRLDVTPGSGEGFLTGDAVNTAARIQSVAPAMGIAVGRSTFEATKSVFDYVELESAVVKGKAEPVAVWQALAPLARFGVDITRRHDTPMVGREIDLALLTGVFDQTVASSSPQLVTIVGEPGLGKSRLVAELLAHVDAQPRLVTWRQGRCLPYGDGITFWALSEIVKAHAGILDTDATDVAEKKLDEVLPDVEERDWIRQRLLPLLGIEATSQAERDELFTAWRTFVKSMAEQDATVLVFEDLHWADPNLLAFVEHLAEHVEGVPLLIVGTARPELYEQYPSYASGPSNTARVNLRPLTPDETAGLVATLLDSLSLPDDLREPLVDRAGGNPLFAEEYSRLLQDRDLIERVDDKIQLRVGAELPLPDNVQALIAARLDTLALEHKALLADAAVIGKVFWAGAIASMADREEAQVIDAMRELSRKELVRPLPQSSMAGQQEYAFWHVLTRDVAYDQLPRAARAKRHVAAAKWIEATSSARPDDVADVLAYHHLRALELARAAGDEALAAEEEGLAQHYLVSAGRRALRLDPAAALAHFQHALALTPNDMGDARRPEVLCLLGEAAHWGAGREPEAEAAYTEAVALYRAQGDDAGLGRALYELGWVLQGRADGRWVEMHEESVTVLERLPPGRDLLLALSTRMYKELNYGRFHETIAAGKDLEQVATEAGLPVPAWAFGYRGMARSSLGDAGGLDDLRTCVELVQLEGDPGIPGALRNLASTTQLFEGYRSALSACNEWAGFARGRGLTHAGQEVDTERVWILIESGELDAADSLADALESHFLAGGGALDGNYMRSARLRVAILRGRASETLDRLPELMRTARSLRSPEDLVVGLGPSAEVHAALGHREQAVRDLEEIASTPGAVTALTALPWLPGWLRSATRLGELELAERILDATNPHSPLDLFNSQAARAVLFEATDGPNAALKEYSAVAEAARRFGAVIEEAFALLGQGRCLIALNRPDEAILVLQHARDMFTNMGARPALAETEAWLASVNHAAEGKER